MERIVGNVGILDLREATAESVKAYTRFINVGTVLYSPETTVLVNQLNFTNLGCRVEVTGEAQLITGQLELSHDSLDAVKKPQSYVVTGQIFVHESVTADEIDAKVDKMFVIGQVMAPKSLMPILQSKISSMQGNTITYEDGFRLISGSVEITNAFLNGLDDASNISCRGRVTMINDVDLTLFQRKINRIEPLSKVMIREEYAEMFQNHLVPHKKGKVTVIPAGYEYIKGRLELDLVTLERLGEVKLFTDASIFIKDDVTEAALKKHVKAIICGRRIICPKGLKAAVLDVCADPAVKILDYEGKLLLIEGDYHLSAAELEFTPGNLAIMVTGELNIDEDVPPEQLMEKISTVDNFGEISGTARQLGALKVKARTKDGEFCETGKESSEDDEQYSIANVGYLKI